MEKVKPIRSETKTSKDGKKTYYEVSLADGRKASGWENLSEFVNKEIDLEITKNGDYLNYKWNDPKKEKGSVTPKSDRAIALECASRMESNPEEVIKAATLYLAWLTKE
jgi:hypothetical protein